jgi:hypothetical protein
MRAVDWVSEINSDFNSKRGDVSPGSTGRPVINNAILSALSLSEFDPLRGYLRPVLLERGTVLNEANKPIEHVNFVETGIVSLMTLARGSMLETAMVGRHGAVEASVALGERTSIHKSIVLVPGKALRIRVEDPQRSMTERPQIRERLLRYVQSLMIHGSPGHHRERRFKMAIVLSSSTRTEHENLVWSAPRE